MFGTYREIIEYNSLDWLDLVINALKQDGVNGILRDLLKKNFLHQVMRNNKILKIKN